jgi:hypothetical protein
MEPLPRSSAELRSEWRNELLAPVGLHIVRAMIAAWRSLRILQRGDHKHGSSSTTATSS